MGSTPLSMLADSLSPAAMVAIGLQLKLRFAADETRPFAIAMLLKLLLSPALLLMLFALLGWRDLGAKVCVFEAGMAPMVSASMLAILAGLNRQFTASVLGYGIVLSFATLPMWYGVIGTVLGAH